MFSEKSLEMSTLSFAEVCTKLTEFRQFVAPMIIKYRSNDLILMFLIAKAEGI